MSDAASFALSTVFGGGPGALPGGRVPLLHPQILSGFQDGARDRSRANARLCP